MYFATCLPKKEELFVWDDLKGKIEDKKSLVIDTKKDRNIDIIMLGILRECNPSHIL